MYPLQKIFKNTGFKVRQTGNHSVKNVKVFNMAYTGHGKETDYEGKREGSAAKGKAESI